MASPNPYHHAVVVGINTYPGGYTKLSGPVADADDFIDWLTDDAQGGVPPENVRRVVTPAPEPDNPDTATPTKQLINQAIWAARTSLNETIGLLDEEDQGAARDASRLYFFVAGHGILPASGEAALLDATSRPGFVNNLEVSSYLSWLVRNGAFAEVAVFADCCRSYDALTMADGPPFDNTDRIKRDVITLLGLATRIGALSYEDPPTTTEEADSRRGHFSKTLVAGLRGNAADPDTGLVTSTSLKNYVQPIVVELTKDKREPQRPQLLFSDDLVFGPKRVAATPQGAPGREVRKVVIHFPKRYDGMVELVGPDGSVQVWDPSVGPWTVFLYDGSWYVQKQGSQQDTSGLAGEGIIKVRGAGLDAHL